MSKLNSFVILLAISLSLLDATSGKTCTKEFVNTYVVYKMNTFTQRLVTATQFKKVITIACCDGYHDISKNSLQPECEPICVNPCGNGTCYSPNRCACDLGFKLSKINTCVADDQTRITTTTTTTRTTATASPYAGNPWLRFQNPNKPVLTTTSTQKPYPADLFPNLNTMLDQFAHLKSTPTTTTVKPASGFVWGERMLAAPTGASEPLMQPSKFVLSYINKPDAGAPTRTSIPPTWQHMTTSRSGKHCEACDHGTCIGGVCFCMPGYKLTDDGSCQPVCAQHCLNGQCIAPNRCQCADGYTYDSESLHCRPLCNGKIYGCMRGTCVGYNQCRCNNGTILHKDELFQCIDGEPLKQDDSNWKWYLLLLAVPAAIAVLSFCFLIRRWKKVKANRKVAQEESFPEIRYYDSSTEHSVNEKHQRACAQPDYGPDEPSSSSRGTIQRNGNVLIINA